MLTFKGFMKQLFPLSVLIPDIFQVFWNGTTGDIHVTDVNGNDMAVLNVTTGNATVTGTLALNTAATTLAGTSAGTVYWVQDQVGTVKRTVLALVGYENTTATAQTITFPVPYTHEAGVVGNTTGNTGFAATTTTLTLPASMTAAINGVVVVEGI